jgi:hypothetical protein
MLWLANIAEAVVSELQERLSYTQDVDELFGTFHRTHRPEAAPHSTSHNNQMIVDLCHIRITVDKNSCSALRPDGQTSRKKVEYACKIKKKNLHEKNERGKTCK